MNPNSSVVEKITHFNAGRDPERLALKYQALASNAFSFLRGTCHLFYERLANHSALDAAPAAWICGDLHLENFGTYKGDNRLVYFDINDFDEAALAPCTWELLRLLSSILVAAQTLSLSRDDARSLARNCAESYASALASGKPRWIDRDAANGLIGELFEHLAGQKRKDFIDSRTAMLGKRRVIRTGKGKALAATDAEQQRIGAWLNSYAASKDNPDFFVPLDIARRVAGTGSLGQERFVILVQGKGGPGGHYLLDLKAAQPSCLTGKTACAQPAWRSEAARIATICAQMQAVPPAFLEAVEIDGRPYTLKDLQPSQDRVSLQDNISRQKQLDRLLRDFGAIAAWGELRAAGRYGSAGADALIAFAQERTWIAPLLELAAGMAQQVELDWREFVAQANKGIDALLAQSV